jgi:hypothetical protein
VGKWLGINASIETATGQFGTLVFAAIYEAFVVADKASATSAGMPYEEFQAAEMTNAGRNVMITCAAVSFISTLMAIPTAIWFPPEKDDTRKVAPAEININDFDIPEDGAVSNMPSAVLDLINEQRIGAGLPMLTLRFGTYADDVDFGLDKLMKQGHDDILHSLKDMKTFNQELKTKPEETRKLCDDFAAFTAGWYARPKEQAAKERMDLANWFCDYLEDAGYQYTSAPAFWKVR